MIIGIGHDLVDIRRIEKIVHRFPERFLNRCFTQQEQDYAKKRSASGRHYAAYAKRFAAKEACAKALGTGFRDGLRMVDIEVVNDDSGAPFIVVHGAAQKRLEKLRGDKTANIHLSLSDEELYASAFVVIEVL